jgi:hypothetical protein
MASVSVHYIVHDADARVADLRRAGIAFRNEVITGPTVTG